MCTVFSVRVSVWPFTNMPGAASILLYDSTVCVRVSRVCVCACVCVCVCVHASKSVCVGKAEHLGYLQRVCTHT